MLLIPYVGNVDGIKELRAEVARHKGNAIGLMLVGDMNVHSKKWLSHSGRESTEANLLRELSEELGMKRRVTQPTRRDTSGSDYLFDLLLSDTHVDITVGPKIRDH